MKLHRERKTYVPEESITKKQEVLKEHFSIDSQDICTAMEEMGNPFEEESADLLTLNIKDIADCTKAEMLKTH